MPDRRRDPTQAGEQAFGRISRLVEGLGGELGAQVSGLLARHGYGLDVDGGAPHISVLNHPLIQLPIWLAYAGVGGGEVALRALLDICESSLCGYLSVRAEDDYLDGDWDEPGPAMMVSAFFRARHQALLAPLVSDPRFWARFQSLWQSYGEAMLLERALHDRARPYGPEEYDEVLNRSQPLEIPGSAVLSLRGRWDLSDRLAQLVRHLTKATQLFGDFVDAPDDLAVGNHTWMVRRLGGLDGQPALRRGMVSMCDEIVAEASGELDKALVVADSLGIPEFPAWVAARKDLMGQAAQQMFEVLFSRLSR